MISYYPEIMNAKKLLCCSYGLVSLGLGKYTIIGWTWVKASVNTSVNAKSSTLIYYFPPPHK